MLRAEGFFSNSFKQLSLFPTVHCLSTFRMCPTRARHYWCFIETGLAYNKY